MNFRDKQFSNSFPANSYAPDEPPNNALLPDRSANALFSAQSADVRRAATLHYAAQITHAIAAATEASGETLETSGNERHIVFQLGDKSYAVPVTNMVGIETPLVTTALPFVPIWHTGIADLRGDIISVIDLRLFLRMSSAARTRTTRVIIVRSCKSEIVVGFTVDAVSNIRRLDTTRLNTPSSSLEAERSLFMRGVCESDSGSLVVLDAEELLSATVIRQTEVAA